MAHWMLFQTFAISMVSHVAICADGLRRPKSGIRRYIPQSNDNFGYLTKSLWTKHAYTLPQRPFRVPCSSGQNIWRLPFVTSHLNRPPSGLTTYKPAFDPRPEHARLAEGEMTLWHVFLRVLLFSSVTTIPKTQHIHISFIYHRRYTILATDTLVK